MDEKQVSVTLTRLNDLEFKVDFGTSTEELLMDEPEPLGGGKGPNAVRVLSAAIGNCLAASLLFCLQKARAGVDGATATVTTTITRNEKGRFRVGCGEVILEVDMTEEAENRLGRCLDLFEDFCIVSASVRAGIDIRVKVRTRRNGAIVYDSADQRK